MRAPTLTRGPTSVLRRTFLLTVLLLVAVVAGACSSGTGGSGGGAKLLHYQRTWPDGTVEQETIYGDGRIEMKHGDTLERITISAADVQRITDALAKPIPTGSSTDSPQRQLTLADGKVIDFPVPDPGTVTVLLESLLQTHALP